MIRRPQARFLRSDNDFLHLRPSAAILVTCERDAEAFVVFENVTNLMPVMDQCGFEIEHLHISCVILFVVINKAAYDQTFSCALNKG